MQTYSFRAECRHDVDQLFRELALAGHTQTNICLPDDTIPDVVVELYTEASLGDLLECLKRIPDSHVMRDTLRPLPWRENHMERGARSANRDYN